MTLSIRGTGCKIVHTAFKEALTRSIEIRGTDYRLYIYIYIYINGINSHEGNTEIPLISMEQ